MKAEFLLLDAIQDMHLVYDVLAADMILTVTALVFAVAAYIRKK